MTSGPAGPGTTADDRRQRLAQALKARLAGPALLAPNQERLYALQQLDPDSTAYAETVALRLRGPLDHDALLSALHALPARHEWLRSRIELGPEGPRQVVGDDVAAEVEQADLRDGDPGADAPDRGLPPRAQEWVRSLAGTPLRLQDGRVWRAGLARVGEQEHVLVLVVHHVACDATSLSVLVDDLGKRYDAAVSGTPVQLPAPPSPRDLAQRVRALQSGPAAQDAARQQVAALSGLDLAARVATSGGGQSGPGPAHVLTRSVPPAVAARAARTAGRHGGTTFALVCVALGAALADAAGVDRPVLGVPVDLRWHLAGSEETVSFLVETAAIALPDLTTTSLAAATTAVSDRIATALEQPPRFEDVVEGLRRSGELPRTGTPLHAYATWLDAEEDATLGVHGPAVTHVDLPLGQAKFDLTWTVVGRGRGLDLRLEYDSARLDRAAADRLLHRAVQVLDVATRDAEAPLGTLERMSAAELAQLREWEGQVAPAPEVDLWSYVRQGLLGAGGPALLSGDERWSGRELVDRVEDLAACLVALGVRPGDRVAVPSRRVPGMVVSLLAVLRAGATFVPVDAGSPLARQAQLAGTARVAAVVGEPAWAAGLAAAVGARAVATDDLGRAQADAREQPRLERSPGELAYLMFTSGSTGHPKGVRLQDSAVVARMESYRELFAADGVRYLLQSTLVFDASVFLFWVLGTGGCLVLADDAQATDPLALAHLVERHEVTDAFFVPGLYDAVLHAALPASLRSLRRVSVGGDVLPPAVADLHHATLPAAELWNVYGPTETVVSGTGTRVAPLDTRDGAPLPIGRPHRGTSARVLDRQGRRVPVGTPGELHLGGAAVADGYEWPAGEAPDGPGPFSVRRAPDGRETRWYATGDLARWRDDGRLDFLGRRDRQVKLRGQRVELGEIEAALRRLPGVDEAAVELQGRGAVQHLVAFVAPETDRVLEALAAVLPAAAVPERVVARPELPRLPSGKLDRAALREEVVRPAGRPEAPREDHGGNNGLDLAVLSRVRALLDDDGIGLDDDFFAVGGNSLLAARLTGQLSAALGVSVPLHALVGHSTVREIAALAEHDSDRSHSTARSEPRLLSVRAGSDLPPAVLLARDGATALVLQHYLAEADPRRPLFVLLRPMPPLGHQVPDLTADGEALARFLVDRFPDGPLHLIGHSASGTVAVQAARALGPRRGVVVLLDTWAPSTRSAGRLRRADDLARVVVKRARLRLRGVRPPRPDGPPPSSRVAAALRLYQESLALAQARLEPVDFPLTVLTSTESRAAVGRDDLGWRRWCPEVHLVPLDGDHHGMLFRPCVVEAARTIQQALASWR